ncbi:cellulose synthase (UDP-forming) [Rhizobium leguminosarum]|uniref:glycosyltransferase family 2 protein n=1 Tax=Rhizobium TaxID=379 RepID=UPI00161293DE|nr:MULTISPECIES: glycosyltransferase family 2 protein [Rhizobium]MBB4296084.1 cellulose synthase (UDP-forming) [Rhizobium leguminosarum]MBB4420309.1 cellulose synthase (UDP-forming) [Rhizobium leguminosarum]MBB4435523.1 cellulose synthase (UDP-forming) [Rhizobium esperanzae]MBB4545113.1 cellulose synthase (UDP-forming) [Rhizobium leguminosarum]MBB5654772.1 cellulose synthase (UDP-forming) [Rhizobium leguminosarum]
MSNVSQAGYGLRAAKAAGADAFDPVFAGRNRAVYGFGIFCWLAALGYFWIWWCQSAHIISWAAFVLISLVLGWITLVPAYFILIFLDAKTVSPGARLPEGRVAMVVTKAPSEPFAVVRATLQAMLDQIAVDFDVWLADEDPSEETRRWCAERGVLISTRKGVAEYHRTTWPRRTRCKEGNLAYFYDHFGYARYDFVAQFDADHVPTPTYLREVLRPFADPGIGYVSAPSICDANAAASWAARGRLYAEASLHGSLQTGYNNGWAPLCIGSHYAVRTSALREIGGLGPELAEDHSTTLMMNAGGWRGVHAADAIAHGDGPANFADLVVQEFQWSRSLVTILLQHSRRYVMRLPLRLRLQFVFSQLWYPLFSAFMAVMFLLPVAALLTGHVFVAVTYPDFLLHFAPISIVLTLFAFFWRATRTFRPHNAKLFGWEGLAFIFLRWPWSLAGSLAAVRDHISGSFVDFRITPKGRQQQQSLPLRVVAPYIGLAGLCAAAMAIPNEAASAQGFYIFAAMNLAIYLSLTVLIVMRHAIENGLPLLPQSRGLWFATATGLAICVTGGMQAGSHGLRSLEALSHGQTIISFSQSQFAVAGAGLGGKTRTVKFRIRWNGFGNTAQDQQGV